MGRIFYDIIPPKEGKTKMINKDKGYSNLKPKFGIITKAVVKIAALMLIISLNWTGLSAVLQTFGSFGNTENSQQNIFIAGILDFELLSSADFPEVCSGEPTERTVNIINYGNPFKYAVSGAEFSGDVCNYVTLEVSLNGEIKYTGPLTGFNSGVLDFSDSADWLFKLYFNADLPSEFLGQTCNFKFVFDGSQTRHDLPLGMGFSDIEEVISNILAQDCGCLQTRTIGYWKNHYNAYKNLLPQYLACVPALDGENCIGENEKVEEKEDVKRILYTDYELSMRNKLRGQLLAMKFNIAYFDTTGDYYWATSSATINEIVAQADALLRQNPAPSDAMLEDMKNLLDYLNNLHQVGSCLFIEQELLTEEMGVCEATENSTEENTTTEPLLLNMQPLNVGGFGTFILGDENNTTTETTPEEENGTSTKESTTTEPAATEETYNESTTTEEIIIIESTSTEMVIEENTESLTNTEPVSENNPEQPPEEMSTITEEPVIVPEPPVEITESPEI